MAPVIFFLLRSYFILFYNTYQIVLYVGMWYINDDVEL